MNIRIRQLSVAVAFAAITAAGITGATLRGETKETDLAATCAEATWPMIPTECLEGADNNAVRQASAITAGTTEYVLADTMNERFAVAFQ